MFNSKSFAVLLVCVAAAGVSSCSSSGMDSMQNQVAMQHVNIQDLHRQLNQLRLEHAQTQTSLASQLRELKLQQEQQEENLHDRTNQNTQLGDENLQFILDRIESINSLVQQNAQVNDEKLRYMSERIQSINNLVQQNNDHQQLVNRTLNSWIDNLYNSLANAGCTIDKNGNGTVCAFH